jgi:hypothetical protein
MSLDFREIWFFLAAEAQIAYFHATDGAQKIHPDATSPVGARGTCTARKRPELSNPNRPPTLGVVSFCSVRRGTFCPRVWTHVDENAPAFRPWD